MKKIVYIILSVVLVVFLVDIIFVKYLFVSKEIKPIQEIPFDNSCTNNEECELLTLKFDCKISECWDGSPIDLAEDDFIGFNSANFSKYIDTWKNKNCQSFPNIGNIPICPQVAPKVENTHFVAICKNHKCTKIRKSILRRLIGY